MDAQKPMTDEDAAQPAPKSRPQRAMASHVMTMQQAKSSRRSSVHQGRDCNNNWPAAD